MMLVGMTAEQTDVADARIAFARAAPAALRFSALPPGWRFLTAEG
jgi:hypothetical protein